MERLDGHLAGKKAMSTASTVGAGECLKQHPKERGLEITSRAWQAC